MSHFKGVKTLKVNTPVTLTYKIYFMCYTFPYKIEPYILNEKECFLLGKKC